MSRGRKKGKQVADRGRGNGAAGGVGSSGKRAEAGTSCASGGCPVRKHGWLIMAGLYGAWLVFLLVLAIRQFVV